MFSHLAIGNPSRYQQATRSKNLELACASMFSSRHSHKVRWNSHLVYGSVDTVFWLFTNLSPNGTLDQILHFSRLIIDLGKHEALEERIRSFNLDGTCHACRQLIAITEELLALGMLASILIVACIWAVYSFGLYSETFERHSAIPLM